MRSMEVVHNPELAGKTQLIQVRKVVWSPVFFHVYCFEPDFSPSSPLCCTWRILQYINQVFLSSFSKISNQLRLKFNTLSCFMVDSHAPCQLIPSFILQTLKFLESHPLFHTLSPLSVVSAKWWNFIKSQYEMLKLSIQSTRFESNYSTCRGRSESICSNSWGAQEKGKRGWNSFYHQNWWKN